MGFLDLPTELRLRIYELLLGGRTIHVGDPLYPASRDQDGIFLCQSSSPDMSLRASDIESIQELFTHRHMGCSRSRGFRSEDFNVLSVCQQVNREAAPVVFDANTFAFSAPRLIHWFQSLLTPRQLENVRRILLYQTNCRPYWREEINLFTSGSLRGVFPGLTHLSLYFETCPADLGGSNGHYPTTVSPESVGVNKPNELARLFGVVSELKGKQLRVLDVNAVDTTQMEEYRKGGSVCAPLDARVVEEWRKKLERELLSHS